MAKKAMVPTASAIQPKMNTGSLSVFSDAENFNTALRMASALAKSTVVPKAYQGNEGNCLIAIEMAAYQHQPHDGDAEPLYREWQSGLVEPVDYRHD